VGKVDVKVFLHLNYLPLLQILHLLQHKLLLVEVRSRLAGLVIAVRVNPGSDLD